MGARVPDREICMQLSAPMMSFGRVPRARSSLRLPSRTLGKVGQGLMGPK